MFFANPWGLLGLLALPTIVILHLFHRRFPPRLVGGLHLWGIEQRIAIEGRRWETLPITPSLLLELLAALLLTLLLAQPRFSDPEGVEHFIVVLDNSASMAAVGGDGVSARDRSIAALRERVEPTSENARLTLIATGRRPALVAGPAIEWSEGQASLDDWQPELPDHSPEAALDLAIQLAEDGGQVLFLTDRLPGTDVEEPAASFRIPEDVEVIAGGFPVANLAITSAHWSLAPQTLAGAIDIRVTNLGPRPQSATVRGSVDGKPAFESQLELDAGSESALQASVPGGAGELTITLTGDEDALAVDSEITLIEPRLKSVRIDLQFAEDDPRRTDVLRVLEQIPAASLSQATSELSIGPDRTRDNQPDGRWSLTIGPLPALTETTDQTTPRADGSETPSPAAEAVTVAGPYLLDKRNPLLEGVQLDGVVWGGVRRLPAGDAPLISCGSLPLLVQRPSNRSTAYELNIDLARSNLTESPDWPVLLSNLVTLRQQALPGLNRWNFRVNEDVRFRVAPAVLRSSSAKSESAAVATSPEPIELTLTHRKSSRTISTLGLIELPAIEHAGIYSLSHDNQLIERFAVNFFDRAESNLLDRESGTRAPVTDGTPLLLDVDSSTNWLILATLLILLALVIGDWLVVRRSPAIDRSSI